jgi:hypothetical protein
MLLRAEIEVHRRPRTQARGDEDSRAVHFSYALQSGHEALIRRGSAVAPRDSLNTILGLSRLGY